MCASNAQDDEILPKSLTLLRKTFTNDTNISTHQQLATFVDEEMSSMLAGLAVLRIDDEVAEYILLALSAAASIFPSPSDSPVVQWLVLSEPAHELGNPLIMLFNRTGDLCTLKLLAGLVEHCNISGGAHSFFYVTDFSVLVDILVREVTG